MKVKDLLLELQKADPETELVFSMADGCCGDREWLEICDVDFDEHLRYNMKSELVRSKDCPLGTVEFFFHAPWFLASCRKAGAAKRAAQEIIDSHAAWQKEQEEKSKK
jgi:hypothetical protein